MCLRVTAAAAAAADASSFHALAVDLHVAHEMRGPFVLLLFELAAAGLGVLGIWKAFRAIAHVHILHHLCTCRGFAAAAIGAEVVADIRSSARRHLLAHRVCTMGNRRSRVLVFRSHDACCRNQSMAPHRVRPQDSAVSHAAAARLCAAAPSAALLLRCAVQSMLRYAAHFISHRAAPLPYLCAPL